MCALNGLSDDRYLLIFFIHVWVAFAPRPHHDHGITDELDDVATVLRQVLGHAFHVSIDAKRQLLVSSDSKVRTSL